MQKKGSSIPSSYNDRPLKISFYPIYRPFLFTWNWIHYSHVAFFYDPSDCEMFCNLRHINFKIWYQFQGYLFELSTIDGDITSHKYLIYLCVGNVQCAVVTKMLCVTFTWNCPICEYLSELQILFENLHQ